MDVGRQSTVDQVVSQTALFFDETPETSDHHSSLCHTSGNIPPYTDTACLSDVPIIDKGVPERVSTSRPRHVISINRTIGHDAMTKKKACRTTNKQKIRKY